jgi:hypothetical protein
VRQARDLDGDRALPKHHSYRRTAGPGPDGFGEYWHGQAEDLINPPMTFDELMDRLARVVPNFAAVVREHAEAA